MQQLRTIIYFTILNFLADCGYQMVKPKKCRIPPPFYFFRKLESEALEIAIGALNPRIYIDLPLAQKLACKEYFSFLSPLRKTEEV